MNTHIDKILSEWSLRVHDGMPDVKNPLHLIQLKSTLHEMKYPREFAEGLLNIDWKENNNIYMTGAVSKVKKIIVNI